MVDGVIVSLQQEKLDPRVTQENKGTRCGLNRLIRDPIPKEREKGPTPGPSKGLAFNVGEAKGPSSFSSSQTSSKMSFTLEQTAPRFLVRGVEGFGV